MANCDVLLIEDDLDIREAMAEFLSGDDLRISTAEDGAATLEFLRTNPMPPVILLDLSLPGMSGEELMGKLNAHPDRAKVKIIIASGWDHLATIAKTLGADGYLRKPYDLGTLPTFIKKHLPA